MGGIEECLKPFELKRRGIWKALVLHTLKTEGRAMLAYDILSTLKKKGFPASPSTIYTTIKELESEGYVDVELVGDNKYYKISEKGEKYLEERSDVVEKIKRVEEVMPLLNKIGLPELAMTIKKLVKVIDKLDESTLEEIREAIDHCTAMIEARLKRAQER